MNSRNLNRKTLILSTLLCSAIGASSVQADDVELYMAPATPIGPNILFVLDESWSMSWDTPTRMSELKIAMHSVLDDTKNDNVNAAIMAYTTRLHPTRVVHDFGYIRNTRATMKTAVDGLSPTGATPSVHALASAVRWYKDGFRTMASPIAANPADNWCKPNYIVFMSDGQPNSNTYDIDLGADPLATTPVPPDLVFSTDPDTYRTDDCLNSAGNPYDGNNGDGSCAGEIANYGFTTDLKTGTGWTGVQNIITHTVGMGPAAIAGNNERLFMEHIAAQGDGDYFAATNTTALTAAFQQILTQAGASIPFTYTAPTIPFDQNNAASSGSDLYVPLLKPDMHKFWYGNIKKYKLDSTGNPLVLRDKNNDAVLDSSLQFIETGAIADYWSSSSADFGKPLAGGAADHMTGTRNLYTNLGVAALTDTTNLVIATNTALDAAIMGSLEANSDLDELDSVAGTPSFADRKAKLLNWLTWAADPVLPDGNSGTVTVSHKGEMGAVLHGQPVVVKHGNSEYVFIATTEGILHAINGTTGAELWSFMPADLLDNVATNFISDWNYTKPHTADHEPIPTTDHGHTTKPEHYGLDGPMTLYETDNGNRYLVFGQRRGGRNYYALNITTPTSPQIAWQIIGGSGDFTALGQTWSKPIFAKMEIEGAAAREVLIFGGGYDDSQDSSYTDNNADGIFNSGDTAIGRADDSMGNAIYIVNAETGAHVKTINSSMTTAPSALGNMKNGIAADILPIDINANGITDLIYAADVGGRIIRVDIPDIEMGTLLNPITPVTTITGTIVADVNSDNTADGTKFQRFFNTPTATYFKVGGLQYISIAITSGHRPEPLSTSVEYDRLYVIKDLQFLMPPVSPATYPTTVKESDLYDATQNLVQDGATPVIQQTARNLLAQADGWYIDLLGPDVIPAPGEKGLSAAKVYDYTILITTYVGTRGASVDSCKMANTVGKAYLYALDMRDGSAKFDFNNDGSYTAGDRRMLLSVRGMPPAPDLIFPDTAGGGFLGGEVIGMVGLEEVVRWADRFHPISWEEVIDD